MGTRKHICRGQALMELAVGMFALALVLAVLVAFTHYIVSSLDMQRTVRREAGGAALNSSSLMASSASKNDTVEVDSIASKFVFGWDKVGVHERVSLPAMVIQTGD